jgi:tRNA (guanine37-N1)-methyltransferase
VRFDVITLFPEIVECPARCSILGRAQQQGFLTLNVHQLRDYATDKHRTVDDSPYGGGAGMVLRCEPIFAGVEAVQALAPRAERVIYLSPSGKKLTQAMARELSVCQRLILLCGHYEGVDERVREHLVDEEISIGDYVLSNGAVAALVLIDAVTRLIPGVLGNETSAQDDSFSDDLLEGAHYTRPPEFRGWPVPEILLSGDHAKIATWRAEQSQARTRQQRPDLLEEKDKKL